MPRPGGAPQTNLVQLGQENDQVAAEYQKDKDAQTKASAAAQEASKAAAAAAASSSAAAHKAGPFPGSANSGATPNDAANQSQEQQALQAVANGLQADIDKHGGGVTYSVQKDAKGEWYILPAGHNESDTEHAILAKKVADALKQAGLSANGRKVGSGGGAAQPDDGENAGGTEKPAANAAGEGAAGDTESTDH
ncbi:uncharacterized protein KY384_005711 [Bacidia gigantensis]|uniref:uncharacterized protein n=1 Tax=Bacidia gigantensis TaxID=2732470 RepID=UPI001D05B205|nr:uncharacterized protein KY384_005711 [Bacidia gigantensis]KAG8529076.1 hypothetical protein KY384_005711 [Bacidia gigantensis]